MATEIGTAITLNPSTWNQLEVRRYLDESRELRDLNPASGRARRAMVIGSTGPFAELAGRRALEVGGTAIDAALTTALTQIALAAGCWVSYAGIMGFVYYEAATGRVHALSAGFRTFKGETEPLSIPGPPEPSGRTALVPGFFAGVAAAHARLGRLPWADLFAPAIYVAEEGFEVGDGRDGQFKMRDEVLRRTPEGREIFVHDGRTPGLGDAVRQPQLAATLRKVAADGVDHIYRGEWARKFVELVNREGGRATLDDLASYEPVWTEPLRGTFNGYELVSGGLPDSGGAALIEGLQVLEEGGIGDPLRSADDFYWLLQTARQSHVLPTIPPAQRVGREHAQRLWAAMTLRGGFVGPGAILDGSHSDYVAVADPEGNMVALCHSINCVAWGATGIFVDGVSIPDSASFQQQQMAGVAPGAPLPNPMNPALALKDGKPYLVSSSIGSGLLDTTLQCVQGVLGLGLSVEEAVSRPLIHGPNFTGGDSINVEAEEKTAGKAGTGPADRLTGGLFKLMAEESQASTDPLEIWPNVLRKIGHHVEEGFPEEFVEAARARGLNVEVMDKANAGISRGYWVGIRVDPQTGELEGGRTPFLRGSVETLD